MARYNGDDSDNDFGGTAARDIAFGRGGDDYLHGLGGNDRLDGGSGEDYLFGDGGNDVVLGGLGNDVAYGGVGNDRLSGDDGNDVLIGDAGDDVLSGGAGDDTLRGSAGVDYFDGGDGFDFVGLSLDDATQGAVADLRTGIVSNDGYGNVETLVSIEGLRGTYYADTLYGNEAANQFSTSVGDTVLGAGGDDQFYASSVERATLDGGDGTDTLTLGTDRTYIDHAGNVVNEQAQQGMVVKLAADRVLNDGFGSAATTTGFENVSTGSGNDRLSGDSHNNILYGDSGDDVILGGAGADILVGGRGSDTLSGGPGADIFSWGYFAEFLFRPDDRSLDVVKDFTAADKLDFRPEGSPLTFLGTIDFGDASRAIRYEIRDGDTYVFARSYTSASHIDLSVKLLGVHHLRADDFINLSEASQQSIGAPFHGSSDVIAVNHLGALSDLGLA